MLSDHVVWLACLAFYVVDCIRFLKPDRILLEEGRRRTWSPVLPFMSSQPVSRTLGVLDLFQPWRAVIAVSWLKALGGPVGRQRNQIRAMVRKLEPLRLVAQLEFFFLFVFGPVITIRWGLGNAILTVLAAHLILSMIVLIVMILRIRAKEVTVGSGLGLWFECLVCPGYQANVFRRTLLRESAVEADAVGLLRSHANRERFVPRLLHYVEELNEHGLVDEQHLAACRSLAPTERAT